jgi:hypothetical protein
MKTFIKKTVIARRPTDFWLDGVAISSTRSVIARNEVTWQSHFFVFFFIKLEDEILTRESTAQDDVGSVG